MKLGWHIGLILVLMSIVWTISYFDSKGIRTLRTLYAENEKLKDETERLNREHQRLDLQMKQLKNKSEFKERIVRLETGYLADKELLIEWLTANGY